MGPSTPQPSDFEVWTYAYDVSGLSNVTLKWRVDADGNNPLASDAKRNLRRRRRKSARGTASR